jgi:hypothetical protein
MFEEVTLTSWAAGTRTAGRWTDGASSTATIRASVQPAGPRDLLHLPEGDRTKGAVKIYTDSELSEGDESLALVPDELTWNGEQWQVQKVWRHALGIGHHKGLALRKERT